MLTKVKNTKQTFRAQIHNREPDPRPPLGTAILSTYHALYEVRAKFHELCHTVPKALTQQKRPIFFGLL